MKSPIGKLQPVVLDILRLGVYQIVMMDRVPVSAAVNEAVEQGKAYANHQAAGLINGVLRAIARNADNLPEPPDLATRFSHPPELVELLRQAVGDELLVPLLSSHNEAPWRGGSGQYPAYFRACTPASLGGERHILSKTSMDARLL